MPTVSSLTPENRFLGLFVGESGTGKTCAEASFPKPIEILDFDGRVRGLLGATWLKEYLQEGVTYTTYPPRTPNLADIILKQLQTYESLRNTGQPIPKTLIVNSLTSMTYAMVCQAVPLTHSTGGTDNKKIGKYVGGIAMAGPGDYGYEAQVTYDIMSYLRSIPIPNILVDAHLIDRYGKTVDGDNYSESVVVGEKLSVRDKIGVNVQLYFDHCFRFGKRESAGKEQYFVKFKGDLPYKTAFPELPMGEVDITGKNFYEIMMEFTRRGK